MYKPLNFWLIGGDHRQAALAHALAEDGHSVHTYALEEGVDPAWVQSSLTVRWCGEDGRKRHPCPKTASRGGRMLLSPAWVQSSLTGAETAHCVILPLPAAKGELLNALQMRSKPPVWPALRQGPGSPP